MILDTSPYADIKKAKEWYAKQASEIERLSRLYELMKLHSRLLQTQSDKDEWGKAWNEVTEYIRKEIIEPRRKELEDGKR